MNEKLSEITNEVTVPAQADRLYIVSNISTTPIHNYIETGTLLGTDRTATEITAGVVPVDIRSVPGNVKRYGAVGDGVTDDYTAFANAILSNGHVVAPNTGSGYSIGTTLVPALAQKIEVFDDITFTGTGALFDIANGQTNLDISCYGITIGDDTNNCVTFSRGTSNRFFFNQTQGFLIHFSFEQAAGAFAAGHSIVENYIGYNLMSGMNAAGSASITAGQGVRFRNTTGDTTIPMEGLELRGGFIWRHNGHGIHIENNVDALYMVNYGAIDNASGGGQDYTVDAGSQQTSAVFYSKFLRQGFSTFGDGDIFINPRNGQIFINNETLATTALDITNKTGITQSITNARFIAQLQGGTVGGTRYTSILAGSRASLSTSDAVNIQAYYDPGTTAIPAATDAKLAGILATFRRNDDASAIEGGNLEFQKRASANTVDLAIGLMNSGTLGRNLFIRADGGISVDNTVSVLRSGSGTPEGSVSAPVGSIYMRTDGGSGTSSYIKESGTGNTGWVVSGSASPISEINTQNGNYTLVADDAGRTIYKASGGAGETYTIPANSSVAFSIGTLIAFDNDGGGDVSIAITTDTLVGTDGVTGTRTLGDNETAIIKKLTATRWRYAASDL